MVIKNGEIVFIIARRLFEKDLRRHFVGEVVESTDTVVRVRGYAFVYDEFSNTFVRREEVRRRVFSLTDAGYIVNLLPADAVLEDIRYLADRDNQRFITDGKTFKMNVSEFSARM